MLGTSRHVKSVENIKQDFIQKKYDLEQMKDVVKENEKQDAKIKAGLVGNAGTKGRFHGDIEVTDERQQILNEQNNTLKKSNKIYYEKLHEQEQTDLKLLKQVKE